MINISFFLKKPVSFKGKCYIYPPSVSEVYDNEKQFYLYRKILTSSQEELEDDLTELAKKEGSEIPNSIPTPFEFLLVNTYYSQEVAELTKQAFKFFIHKDITFMYQQKQILLDNMENAILRAKDLNDLPVLTEDEFFDFQKLIRQAIGAEEVEPFDPDMNPRIRAMKAKARYRDKIKAKQHKGISFEETIVSICCMNMGLNPLNIGEISYAAVPILTGKFQSHEQYDTDIRCLIGGGDPKKIKPKYWIGESDKN